ISMVNVIVGLFVVMATYLSIETIVVYRKMHQGTNFSAYFLLPSILLALLAVQTVIEIKMIKKLNEFLDNQITGRTRQQKQKRKTFQLSEKIAN
ncbi:MAG: hypothetical protein ACKO96_13145, partial [Flammeovirgaceae bacterium]